MKRLSKNAHSPAVRDVLAGGQDSGPGRARTDVLSRHADPHAMLKIAGLPPRRPHLADMPVIVRHQDRGALRLDHRHDQALCRRRAVI